MNRRAALAAVGALAAGSVLGVGYVLRSIFESPTPGFRLTNGPGDGGMMGVGPADMSIYMDMFMRHNQINRVVEEIPGGVRTTIELARPGGPITGPRVQHVPPSGVGSEVTCMSQSLPTLFRNAGGYRRHLTFTPTGVIAEETADDPNLTSFKRSATMPGR